MLLANARLVRRDHPDACDVPASLRVVHVVAHEVAPGADDDVGHPSPTLDVVAPELVVVGQRNLVTRGEVGDLVVDRASGSVHHVAHVDVGHKVPEEELVGAADAERLGSPALAEEPLDMSRMDVPARHVSL